MRKCMLSRWTFILLTFAFACSGGYAYKDHVEDFSNKVWKKDRTLEFSPAIKDSSVSYRLILDFRHVYEGFPGNDLKLGMKVTAPSGEDWEKKFTVPIKEKRKGKTKHLSNCSGGICDRRADLVEELRFSEKGEYKIELQHRMPMEQLPNVMKVGILLKKNMSGEDVAVQKDAVQGR